MFEYPVPGVSGDNIDGDNVSLRAGERRVETGELVGLSGKGIVSMARSGYSWHVMPSDLCCSPFGLVVI